MHRRTYNRDGKRKAFAIFVLLVSMTLILYILYIQSDAKINQNTFVTTTKQPLRKDVVPEYLVDSLKCRMPNLHAFNEDAQKFYKKNSYKSCTKEPLLSYTTVNENQTILHINETSIPYYSKDGISCCYSSVKRETDKKQPDDVISISTCNFFEMEATTFEDIIMVTCNNSVTHKEIYKNVHAAIRVKEEFKIQLNTLNTNQPLSVLIIGIDTVSRLNFVREMSKTHLFLKKSNWLEFQGYNKVGDNTFPNVMAILSGMNESTATNLCKPTQLGYLDKCELLLYDYRNLSYVTAYAEDESAINTFNYLKKGFVEPPTNYYFRPYLLATDHHLKSSSVDDMGYCTGPESSGERILHLAKDFSEKFKEYPYFGFFWMNTFSHGRLNAISRMDEKVHDFLEDLQKNEIFNNTLVLFLSDHGLRFGEMRYTTSGWLEDRLPILFMSVPEWFKKIHPEKYNNLVTNQNRLTTPYDLHMMLQEVLVISGAKYSIKPSSACPNCRSLFEEMELNRSCEDASIELNWCTCTGYEQISKDNATVQAAASYTLDKLNNITRSHRKCRKFKIKRVMSASISRNHENWYKNDTYIVLVLETKPKAIFEGTVNIIFTDNKLDFKLEGSISRLDSSGRHSYCTKDYFLRNYCYCK